MKFIYKLIRIIFFLVLYWIIAFVIVAIAFQGWTFGSQILFIFGAPIILVWWQERQRSRKVAPLILNDGYSEKKDSKPISTNRSNTNDKRIASGHENTYQVQSTKSGWIPSTEMATVAGRNIGGMVYVGKPAIINRHGFHYKCRAYIDPSLSVARKGSGKVVDDMPYWPNYSDISPRCRSTYLDWLASGRCDKSYNPGYMFLYFYGLERRIFVDQSKEDFEDIISEVRRLKSRYQDNHSVKRYLGEFLDIATLILKNPNEIEPVFERQGWDLPYSLKYAIGAKVSKGENLSADWLLSWFICHPESNLRTPAMRCRDEFLALFRIRFDMLYPEGLKVNKPRKSLVALYNSASSEFEVSINPADDGNPIPDISNLRKPIKMAQEIADEVMNDLDKLSRFIGRNPDGRGSIEAHALLPLDLRELFPFEEMDNIISWGSNIVDQGGLVPLKEVILRLEGKIDNKIGKRQLTGAADALARLGFGLAPDPRFALRSPKPEEPVVLFNLGRPVEKLEMVSEGYRNTLIELAIGSYVAHVDGRIDESESRALKANIDTAKALCDHEKCRLHANLVWYQTVAPDMTLLRRKLNEIDNDSQTAIRRALIRVAIADGTIHSDEVSTIEKFYKALGLDPVLAYSDLHAGEVADGPRVVRASQPGYPGETIPEPEKTNGTKLDTSRIATILSDTERVSSVLGQIFDNEEDQDHSTRNQSLLPGLDPIHCTLVLELVTKENWSEVDFEQLCRTHGLMAAGALEVVNEWAFETYEESLLDQYEGYDVSPEITGVVIQKIQGENNEENQTA